MFAIYTVLASIYVDDYTSWPLPCLNRKQFAAKVYRKVQQALSRFKQIMLVEQTPTYRLYAKTGGGSIGSKQAIGWYVGVIERKGEMHYFALNLQDETFAKVSKKRIALARRLLAKAGLLD